MSPNLSVGAGSPAAQAKNLAAQIETPAADSMTLASKTKATSGKDKLIIAEFKSTFAETRTIAASNKSTATKVKGTAAKTKAASNTAKGKRNGTIKKGKGKGSKVVIVTYDDGLTKLPLEIFNMVTATLPYVDKKRLKLSCKSLRDRLVTISCDTLLENILWQCYLLQTMDVKRAKKLRDEVPGPFELLRAITEIDRALGHYYADVANDIRVLLGDQAQIPWYFESDEKHVWTGKRDQQYTDYRPIFLNPSKPARPWDFGKHLVEPMMHTYGSSKASRPYCTLAYQTLEALEKYVDFASSNQLRYIGAFRMQYIQLRNIYGRVLQRIEVRKARMVESEDGVEYYEELRDAVDKDNIIGAYRRKMGETKVDLGVIKNTNKKKAIKMITSVREAGPHVEAHKEKGPDERKRVEIWGTSDPELRAASVHLGWKNAKCLCFDPEYPQGQEVGKEECARCDPLNKA